MGPDFSQHGRLEPAEREIPPVLQPGARELEGLRIPAFRRLLDRRAAGVGESKQPGDLVERLAGSVVERAPQALVGEMVAHEHQFGVAARDDQRHQRKLRFGFLFNQPDGIDVRFQVIDPQQREAGGQCQPFCHVHAHDE